MARVSLKDIAKKLEVSTATVSLVLNGKDKNGRVSEAVAKKIRKEAKAMNYEPNNFARGLKSGHSKTIGLIVADISNPFFANLAFHIQEHAEKQDYSVIITNTNENEKKMEKMIHVLKSRHVDGFIIVPTENGEKYIKQLVNEHAPVVLLDRYFPEIDVSCVVVNNYQASMKATDRLINAGCKKIALLIYNNKLQHMVERKNGYIAALSKKKLFYPSLIKEINYRDMDHDINNAIRELVEGKKVDGIFFATNSISIIGLKQLLKMNKKIPEDIKVMCFDSNEAFDLAQIPIPFVQQPIPEMGRRAVNVVIEQIKKLEEVPVHIELLARLTTNII